MSAYYEHASREIRYAQPLQALRLTTASRFHG
jgi:hypothetical protein